MKPTLTRLFMPIAFASLTGCATTHGFDSDTCQEWTESSTNTSFLAHASSKIVYEAKLSCKEGEAAARATLAGRNQNGKLQSDAAKIGADFIEIVEEKIKHGDTLTKEFYADVLEKFQYFLKALGGVSIADVKRAAQEENKKQIQISRTKNTIEAPTDSICTHQGIKRVCEVK